MKVLKWTSIISIIATILMVVYTSSKGIIIEENWTFVVGAYFGLTIGLNVAHSLVWMVEE